MSKHSWLMVVFLNLAVGFAAAAGPGSTLSRGDRGAVVRLLQEWLAEAGHPLSGGADSIFGPSTKMAVREFQAQAGLTVDGVVGPSTWSALGQAALDGGKMALASRDVASSLASWETIERVWSRGSTAWLIDARTRKTIKIVRTGGHLHADIEPATAADTRMLRSWYGSWSWARRPVFLKLDRLLCGASINGMPHGGDRIKNGFPGHFCLHLLSSRLHHSGRFDADHQRQVMQAARLLRQELVDREPEPERPESEGDVDPDSRP